jgi:sugar phosphate isomerase/epimerase
VCRRLAIVTGNIGAVEEVRDRRPRVVGDGGDRLVQRLAELDGDREPHVVGAARTDDLAAVEAGVGPQRERAGGAGAADAFERLAQEAGRAAAGVGVAAPQPGVQDIAVRAIVANSG